jgi:hypothetical protein
MTNIYHIFHQQPVIDELDMPIHLETLAKRIVASGRLRIDANEKQNFAKFSLPYQGINIMFSLRELTDPNLLKTTENILSQVFSLQNNTNNLKKKVREAISSLKAQIRKAQAISYDLEMRLARLIVQSAHPSVILLLIYEQAELYISYSYNIGDMMDIVSWKQAGQNSGMQSTDGRQLAVYVSAGGDPFGDTQDEAIYGDGIPAMARILVIAGQELGHYADIMRDSQGRQYSRHSANFSCTRAKEHVRIGRLDDMANISSIQTKLKTFGIDRLVEVEKSLKFFRKNKRKGIIYRYTCIKYYILKCLLEKKCRKYKFDFIYSLREDPYPITQIIMMLQDTMFNLKPDANVYKRADKQEEEAIACVEALARVPQQVNKWGHFATRSTMRNLYNVYYNEVIPACIKACEDISDQKYNINPKLKLGLIEKAIKKVTRRVKKVFRR